MYGLRLGQVIMREIKHLAVDQDRPMNDVVEEALRDLLKKYQGKRKWQELDEDVRPVSGVEDMENLGLLKEITAAAERFVNKAPRQARIETERQALLDAITRAQLLLSVSGENEGATTQDAQRAAGQRTLYGPALRTVQGGKAKPSHETSSRAEKTAKRNVKRR